MINLYGYEATVVSPVQSQRGSPLVGCVTLSFEIGGREQSHYPACPAQCVIDLQNEVLSRRPVPYIELDGVARLDELPGNPFGPCTILPRVAYEQIALGGEGA